MTKKDFIELANMIRNHNNIMDKERFTDFQIEVMATFLKSQNFNFKRERWIAYIKGECGPNGGKV